MNTKNTARVTFFRNGAARSKKEVSVSVEELAKQIRETHASEKTKLPWLKLGVFGDRASSKGCLRNDQNVEAITGLEVDYDGGKVSFKSAIDKVKELDLEAIAYTSPSHTPKSPRWRLLFPTKEELHPSERTDLFETINEKFGNIFSPESRVLSQSYYYGYVDGNEKTHSVQIIRGKKHIEDITAGAPSRANSFSSIGEDLSTNIVDAEERLRQMSYKAGDDRGIHATQLSVTASLLCAGMDEDEVVERVLEATMEAAKGRNWNWKEEEENLRSMCEAWQEKRKKEGTVVRLVQKGKKRTVNKKNIPLAVFNWVMDDLKKNGRDLIRAEGQWWMFTGGIWSTLDPTLAQDWIDAKVAECCDDMRIPTSQRLASEVRHLVKSQNTYEDIEWDSHGGVATMSGLINSKGDIEPLKPEHFATTRATVKFDKNAKCPEWLNALSEALGGDEEVEELIQEIAGSMLFLDKSKSLTRALVLIGPSNTGKTVVAGTISGLVSENKNTTTFDMLEGTHGTMAFVKNWPWIVDEAFESGKWHFSSKVKQILSGDTISINIKNGPILAKRFTGPTIWTSNYSPQFREVTSAIANRVMLVELERIFDPSDMTGIWGKAHRKGFSRLDEYFLETEGSGILNWALEGWHRLKARGYFIVPQAVQRALDAMQEESNSVLSFVNECLEVNEECFIARADLYGAFYSWWEEARGGKDRPSAALIRRGLMAATKVQDRKKRVGEEVKRGYGGVSLNDTGLDYWQSFASSDFANRNASRIAATREEVNVELGASEEDEE